MKLENDILKRFFSITQWKIYSIDIIHCNRHCNDASEDKKISNRKCLFNDETKQSETESIKTNKMENKGEHEA